MITGEHNAVPETRQAAGHSMCPGFTLVEVLVAVVILAVSIVAVLSAFNHSLYAFGESRNVLKANMLIMDKMSEMDLLAAREGEIAAEESNGSFSDENRDFQWECRVTRVSEPAGIGSDPVTLNQVDLTVWREGSQRRYSACTFIRTEKKQ